MKTCAMCKKEEVYEGKSYCPKCLYVRHKNYENRNRAGYQMNREEFVEWYYKTTPGVTRDDLIITKVNK